MSSRFPRLPFQAVDARREAHHSALLGVLRAPCTSGSVARLTAWAHRYGVASLRELLAACEGIDAGWWSAGMLPPEVLPTPAPAPAQLPTAPAVAPAAAAPAPLPELEPEPELEPSASEAATPRTDAAPDALPEPSPPIGRAPMPTHPSLEQLRSWLPDEPMAS